MPENTWNVITESLDLLRTAAASISDANREAPTPCSEWTVTQVLQHAVGDQLAWAAAIGAGTGPSENPFAPSGRLEESVGDLLDAALATARAAWAGISADDLAVPTPLPQGALAAPAAGAACALDAAVHAWDIAVALGRPGLLADQLAGSCSPPPRRSSSRCASSARTPLRSRRRPTTTVGPAALPGPRPRLGLGSPLTVGHRAQREWPGTRIVPRRQAGRCWGDEFCGVHERSSGAGGVLASGGAVVGGRPGAGSGPAGWPGLGAGPVRRRCRRVR